MENPNILPSDTSTFLEVLGKDPATTRIRAIANTSTAGKGAIKLGCEPQKLDQLSRRRFGIYVVINNGLDEDNSIVSCPALFVEHDDLSIEDQAVCWKGLLPEPTIQIWTGGKSLHQYWVLDSPISPERWLSLQEKLISALKSDPSVKNLSRVMRLPGYTYYNKKGEQGPAASIYACSGAMYKIEKLEGALAGISVTPKQKQGLVFKSNSNDWSAVKPCPICGRDLDDKCRITADETFIQCHIGDTFMPPSVNKGASLRGLDGQQWKPTGRTSNVFGEAIGFKLAQEPKMSGRVKNKTELIEFVQDEYRDRLAWNDLKRRLELHGEPIKDLNLMHCELASKHGIHHTSSNVSDAFLFVGKQSTYNPVQDFLLQAEACEPTCCLEEVGSKYLSLKRPIESRVLGIHLLAAVYRAFHPGYQYDQILILRGKQGVGKTRAIKALAGSPEHYVSTSVLTNDKDLLIQIGACWHCEFEEIDGHIDSRHEAQLKALISRHTDNYRAPYAASVEDQPRRCVFWGTTNQEKLLVDSTGNRRMMIIDLIEEVDHDRLKTDLMKIWAAVMQAYRAGEKPLLTRDEIDLVAQIAMESFKEDPWLGIIEARVDGTPVVFEHHILKSVLGMEVRQIKGGRSGDQRRVRDCLTQLGYQRYPHQINGLNQHNVGYAARTRGAWFAPEVKPSSNGQEICDLLKAAGKKLPEGPGYDKFNDPFSGPNRPF
jgi:predicted P-loop ATPase